MGLCLYIKSIKKFVYTWNKIIKIIPGKIDEDPTPKATMSVIDVMLMATPDWAMVRPNFSSKGFV